MNNFAIPGLKTKISLSIACVIILLELSGIYLYVTASKDKIFSQNYHSYQPRVSRGASRESLLKESYLGNKMDSVIAIYNIESAPVPEDYLLAGIAYLEKNQPAKAIETFKTLMQKNADDKTDFFEQDAEYYLAMSYLSNNETEKAMPIFEKIQADLENPYNANVSDWFVLNVKTLIAKK